MMHEKKVLAVIPARGGSKGIPHKNVTPLAGLPLIAHTLQALQGANNVADHLVSTDDEEIAAVARQYGGKVPFLRPAALARDDTNIMDVLQDLLRRLTESYDYMLLLQPTAPLRSAVDIDAAIELAYRHEAKSVCSFMPVDSYHPWYMYYLDWGERDSVRQVMPTKPGMRRQDFPDAVWRNGAIYLVSISVLQRDNVLVTPDCVPYIMPPERSVNIDSIEDLRLAEYYLESEKQRLAMKS